MEIGELFKLNERLLRVFMHRGIVDTVVATRSSASVSRFHDEVVAILLTKRDAIAHEDPELAIDVAFRMAWGTLARQIMYWPTFEAQRTIAWDTLVHELGARMCRLSPRGRGGAAGQRGAGRTAAGRLDS